MCLFTVKLAQPCTSEISSEVQPLVANVNWPIAVMYQSNPTGTSPPPPRGAFAYLVSPGGGALTNFVWPSCLPQGNPAFDTRGFLS